MYWDQLTSPEIDALERSIPVILPIAATEQHGPHLPLATDRMIGEHFCRKIHEAIPEKTLILPIVAIGCSEHHMEFAGSLTLSHESFSRQVEDILKSVAIHGFRNLIILNSHGGNLGIGTVITEKFGYRYPEIKITFVTWWKVAGEALFPLNESGPGGVGHACEFETSLMLLIAPDLVKTKLIRQGANEATFPWAEGDMLRGPRAGFYRTMKAMTPNGVYGDPRKASTEKGWEISRIVTESLVQLITDLRNVK
ncbi:MAG: creatininase family protein [Bacteroidia bacterium]|nr:creatininase family protein [Bacteroidia bacterium]